MSFTEAYAAIQEQGIELDTGIFGHPAGSSVGEFV
jgi:hypothetical protein